MTFLNDRNDAPQGARCATHDKSRESTLPKRPPPFALMSTPIRLDPSKAIVSNGNVEMAKNVDRRQEWLNSLKESAFGECGDQKKGAPGLVKQPRSEVTGIWRMSA